jgi:hypothetical protein
VLCGVGALWCFIRALEHGATKWLVAAGVCVGLAFEAKMGAALMVLPGMALAWLWVAPRGRLVAVRQLALAGGAMIAVALAWPVLVWLTPASSRPWISGTSDNSIWSLIWEYNGFGRLEGQTGGPASFGGGGGGPFGGTTGVFRLLNEALGGQAGWLLGTAAAGGLGIAALSRLRRTDPRTGWIIAVGGTFAVTAVAFSFAGGIFHPYYTSLLAPFTAALVGATFAQARAAGPLGRILGAVAIGAGAIIELLVIDGSASDLGRLVVPLVLVAVAAIGALLFADAIAERLRGTGTSGASPARIRLVALACGFAILLVGPAIWSVDTLGHPTSGTFPAGGPESASMMGGPGGMGGASNGSVRTLGHIGRQSTNAAGQAGGPPTMSEIFGGTGGPPSMREAFGGGTGTGGPPSMGGVPSTGGAAGGMFGGEDLSSVLEYTEGHGGGTIAVDSQSGASASIIEEGAEVAGIGGFSGKESSVSAAWLEERIDSGAISWIYTSGLGGTGAGLPGGPGGGSTGDTRNGSESAIDTVVRSCTEVPGAEGSGTLYRCG